MKTLLLFSAVLLAAPFVRAEEMPMDAVVRASLDHSFARRGSEQELIAAKAREAQAIAKGRPSFDVTARATRYNGLEESTLGALTIPELETRYAAVASAVQPLYTGGRLSGQREAETYSRQAAEAKLSIVASDIELESIRRYWDWSRTFQSVVAAQASVERMQAMADDLKNQRAAGLATENDALAVEVELERAHLRQETARQQLQLVRAQIAYLTGVPLAADATPAVAPVPQTVILPPESDLLALAFSNRAERALRAFEVRAAEARFKMSKAERGPVVNLRAGYEYANPNQLFFPQSDEWNDDAFLGVEATWNLWDSGLTRGHMAESAARRMQAELQREQTDEAILLDVRAARIILQEALNRHAVALRAETSARSNLDSATALWKSGMARPSDALDAQARLADAEQAVVAALADIAAGRAGLDRACGVALDAGPNP